ncbi:cyclic nucleotide-binding protein [Krasilnikovia cinnamomea]|uniref:Cyclic nucleotide-binding protein n=1 Tax=Krasilnikovia cinnamomea TaxID=349313 RepID=A0A4Q7ZST8_9ACTN|nr:cyclic nucleotide-binding domain-containing protein [Krasilnikovia cinnamomea]RZU53549.1 cyclic nucleotide-binding protein [Krasilnikovia cinnamomea]
MSDPIAAHTVFAELSDAQRAQLAAYGTPESYRAGERLFAEGGDADRFWLIGSGSVALDMRVPGRGEQVIETLSADTVLGWSWLHPPYRWHFGAVAREDTTTVVFDAAAVRDRCADDPAFGYAILRCFTPVIIERLMATRLRVLDLYATPAQAGRPSTEVPS